MSIDAATGEVTLNADPDFEAQSIYSFGVIATDAAGNASAAQSVTLDINNLDEIAPTFNSSATASLLESTVPNNIVYRAVVDDSSDVSAGVTFQLSGDSDDGLSIDPATGEVTLAPAPNYEEQASYQFTVIADDGINQSRKLLV